MANRFVLNGMSYHGHGAINEIPGIVKGKGLTKAFVASDPDLVKFGVTSKVTDLLAANDIAFEVYSDIKPNPTIENVQHGVDAYKASGADFMITIGGGSSMDTGKGIGIIVNNPEFYDVRSLEGLSPTKNRTVFTIAVPTTGGTGAESTINYVITDVEKKRKFVCVDPNDIPDVAVVDDGIVTAVAPGHATIVVTIEDEEPILLAVTVLDNGELPEEGTERYTVTINYIFGSGDFAGKQAADPFVASYSEGYSGKITVPSPTGVTGYAPDKAVCEIDIPYLTGSISTTVYYLPAAVTFTVRYYFQTINGTASSYVLQDSVTVDAFTEDQVKNYIDKYEIPCPAGYIRLAYDKEQKVAADGSTIVAIFYERKNVMVKLLMKSANILPTMGTSR